MKSDIDIDDNELLSLLADDEENIKDIIYEKYGYIIGMIIRKYYRLIKMFQIDYQEVYCEASYGFSDGINCFNDNKNASFKTFLTLCVERRVTKLLTKYSTKKAQTISETLSLENNFNGTDLSLSDIISDDANSDPLNNLTSLETYTEIIGIAKRILSNAEYIVFTYMTNNVPYQEIARILEKTPKQIDNTIQRIKLKMRKELALKNIN